MVQRTKQEIITTETNVISVIQVYITALRYCTLLHGLNCMIRCDKTGVPVKIN